MDELATGMDDIRFRFFGGGFVFAAGNGGEEEEEKECIFHYKNLILKSTVT